MTTTLTSTDAVSQSFEYRYLSPGEEMNFYYVLAAASADWLSISVSSRSMYSVVNARATSEVTFAPQMDGLATIGFDHVPDGPYSDGVVSLYDVVAGLELWRYTWGGGVNGTVTFPDAPAFHFRVDDPDGVPVLLPAALSADHIYTLRLSGRTNSRNDSSSASVRVTGLVNVPEPSTLLLLSMSFAGLVWRTKDLL
jgi:hypothetical protein